jgi:tetratricopeptide (TPR) repeat protein
MALGAAVVFGAGAAAFFANRPAKMVPFVPEEVRELKTDLGDFVRGKLAAAVERPDDSAAQVDFALALHFNNLFRGALPNFQALERVLPDDPKPILYQGHCYREFGDVAKAEERFSEAIKRFPDFAPPYYERGRIKVERADLDGAAEDFEAARRLAPERFNPWLGLGDVAVRRRDYAKARELLEKASQIDPGDKTARYQLGLALRGLGLRSDAERKLAEGSGSYPRKMAEAWSERQHEFSRSASDLTTTAVHLIKTGRAADGIKLLERLYAAEPNNIEILNNLSGAYQDTKQFAKAKDLLERAVERDPTRDATLANLSSLYINLNEPTKALEYADRALKLAPTFATAHFNRANALARMNRTADAAAAYREAVRFDPKNGRVRYAYASTLVAQNNLSQAKQEAERGVLLEPDFMGGRLLLISILDQIGDAAGARAAYAAAAQRAPNDPELAKFAKKYR